MGYRPTDANQNQSQTMRINALTKAEGCQPYLKRQPVAVVVVNSNTSGGASANKSATGLNSPFSGGSL